MDDDAEYTTTGIVDLDLTYHDGTGVSRVELSLSPDFSDPVEVDVGTDSLELDLGATEDGPVTVYLRVTDLAGNSAIANDTIEVFFPKVIGSVVIRDEPEVTNMPFVTLEIETPIGFRVKTMQISEDPAFEGVEWMTYEEEKLWPLSDGDGPKTIYVRFRDFRDIASLPINASTVLDGTLPTVSLTIMGGLEYTIETDLQVDVTYTDASPVTRMWLSTDGEFDREEPEPFKQTLIWTIPAVEGVKTLYLMVEDLAGNLGVADASIHYASVEPVVSATLVGGSPVGDVAEVLVSFQCVDPYGDVVVQASLDTHPADTQEWMECTAPLAMTIPTGTQEGSHTVYFRGRNIPGLVSEVSSLEFELDLTAPAVAIDAPVDGKKVSQKGHVVTLSLSAEDASVIASARYRVDGGSWIEIDHISTLETEVDLGSYGEHTIEVEVVDIAGNTGTSSSTFKLEKEEDSPAVGVLGAIVAIGTVAFAVRRRDRGWSVSERP
jgi:hypothetical protein